MVFLPPDTKASYTKTGCEDISVINTQQQGVIVPSQDMTVTQQRDFTAGFSMNEPSIPYCYMPHPQPQNMILVHVNAGETFTIQAENSTQCIAGPAQVPMVSPNGAIPPIHVPPGYVAQVLEDNGVRRVVVTRNTVHPPMFTQPMNHPAMRNSDIYIPPNFMPHSMPYATDASTSNYPPPQHAKVEFQDAPRVPGSSIVNDLPYNYLPKDNSATASLNPKPAIYSSGQLSSTHTESPTSSSVSASSGSSFCTTPSPTDSPEASPRISSGGTQNVTSGKYNRNTKQRGTTSPLSTPERIPHNHKEHQKSQIFSSKPDIAGSLQQKMSQPFNKDNFLDHHSNQGSHYFTESGIPVFTHPGMRMGSTSFPSAQPMSTNLNYQTAAETNDEAVKNILSCVSKPQVIDIQMRSAQVHWEIFTENEQVSNLQLQYRVYCERVKDSKPPQIVYHGPENRYEITNLKPAVQYLVSIQATIGKLEGKISDKASFQTLSSIPDTPGAPKFHAKSKNSLTLKWVAPHDNGEKILKYSLEWDEGKKGSGFRSLFTGPQKQQKINKLSPSCHYTFRLSAINKIGKSPWSPEVTYQTSEAPPPIPEPPECKKSTVNKLTIKWNEVLSTSIVSYILEMDELTGYGFRAVYNGHDTVFTVGNLTRNREYLFRLCSRNADGQSQWTSPVTFKTNPDKPQAPSKPYLRGKALPKQLRIGWDAPKDTGGTEIEEYILEINKDRSSAMKVIYQGPDTEFLFTEALPGHSYKVRVSCTSDGGDSQVSDLCILTTPAVQPGACAPPLLGSKPRPTSILLTWDPPTYDGGSKILTYEVKYKLSSSIDEDMKETYKGPENKYVVSNLIPGTVYDFIIRAFNKIGHGPWSEISVLQTAPGPPEAPDVPTVLNSSATTFSLEWKEPICNGSSIIHYNLEWGHSHGSMSVTQVESNDITMSSLIPNTIYFFRLQAVNGAGQGSYSEVGTVQTGPSYPVKVSKISEIQSQEGEKILNAEPGIEATEEEDSAETEELYNLTCMIGVKWDQPVSNGSPITKYLIEYKAYDDNNVCFDTGCDVLDRTESTDNEEQCFYFLSNLEADTEYRICVVACNAIGQSQASDSLKARTHPLPPAPPILSCIGNAHNSLKLKWEDQAKQCTSYLLQMQEENNTRWLTVYRGSNHKYQVNRLSELTNYKFRINSRNNAGEGVFSDVYLFGTSRAPLPVLPEPKVSLNREYANISWSDVFLRKDCEIRYSVCLQKTSDSDERLENSIISNSKIPLCTSCSNQNNLAYIYNDAHCRLGPLDNGESYEVSVAVIKQIKSSKHFQDNGDVSGDSESSEDSTKTSIETFMGSYSPPHLFTVDIDSAPATTATTYDQVSSYEGMQEGIPSQLELVENSAYVLSDDKKTTILMSLYLILSITIAFFLQLLMV